MNLKEDIAEVIERVAGSQLQKVQLGPGVVGRNSSIAWALELVMLAGVVVGGLLRSVPLVAIALIGGIVTALVIVLLNVSFGRDNPAAALLGGGRILRIPPNANDGGQRLCGHCAAIRRTRRRTAKTYRQGHSGFVAREHGAYAMMRRYVHLGINPTCAGRSCSS